MVLHAGKMSNILRKQGTTITNFKMERLKFQIT